MRELSCPHCGAQIEVSIPGWPHHLSALAFALPTEIIALVLLALIVMRSWFWLAFLIAVLVAIDCARSAWLRRKATINWVNRESMERRASGKWVPD